MPGYLLKSFEEWALRDAEREAANGFQRIKQIANGGTLRFLSMTQYLEREEMSLLLLAKVKGRFRKQLSAHEIGLLQRFREHFDEPCEDLEKRMRRGQSGDGRGSVSTRLLGKAIGARLERTPFLKGASRHSAATCFTYRVALDDLVCETSIDIGGTYSALTYDHRVSWLDSSILMEGISILNWLGFGRTDWQYLIDDDVAGVAETLACGIDAFGGFLTDTIERGE